MMLLLLLRMSTCLPLRVVPLRTSVSTCMYAPHATPRLTRCTREAC